jgi:ADP-heptose:LPS heptosyltransferase
MPQSSPSVLIIRLDGIGDALALAPLVAALQDRATSVDVLLSAGNAGVFSTAALARVDVAPFALRSSSPENLRAIDAFGDALRGREYGSVLVATEDPGGYRLARRIAAERRIGFSNGWRKPFKTLWVRSLLTRALYRAAALDASGQHECEILFRLGRDLVEEAQPTQDLRRLRPLVLDRDVERGNGVAIQVTQKWQRFGVGARELASLVRLLAARWSVECIAAQSEQRFADVVSEAAGVGVTRFAALKPWKESIAAAGALVAPDSGATHVAGMVGTPVVALFPAMRHAEREIARWHPWAAPWRAVTVSADWMGRTQDALASLTSSDRA